MTATTNGLTQITGGGPLYLTVDECARAIEGARSFGELIEALHQMEGLFRDGRGSMAAAAEVVRVRCKQTGSFPGGLDKEFEGRRWRKLLNEVAEDMDDAADAARALRIRVEEALAAGRTKRGDKGFDTKR